MTPLQQRLGVLRLRFVDRARGDRARIEQALRDGDLAGVHALSHRLFGIAGTFGFAAVSAAAAELEAAIEECRPDVGDCADRLLDELAEMAPEVL